MLCRWFFTVVTAIESCAAISLLDSPFSIERRIALLRDRLDRAVIIEADVANDTVGIGTTVEIEDEQGERTRVEISSVGGVSPDSPVGQALLGRKAGDEVEVRAPRGSWRARIVSISPSEQ
jgi:transcription elongation factor GreA